MQSRAMTTFPESWHDYPEQYFVSFAQRICRSPVCQSGDITKLWCKQLKTNGRCESGSHPVFETQSKSCRSSWLESQIKNVKMKKNQQKVPGPPPKLLASDWRTCGNFQHWRHHLGPGTLGHRSMDDIVGKTYQTYNSLPPCQEINSLVSLRLKTFDQDQQLFTDFFKNQYLIFEKFCSGPTTFSA